MSPTPPLSVQETYAPANRCFGCGAANLQGLRLKSFLARAGDDTDSETGGDTVLVAEFQPAPHHLAFEGIVNGGMIGALLDCHSNWTAAVALMRRQKAASLPCTVTADFHVRLKRPTPLAATLKLRAHPVQIADDRAVIEATLEAEGQITHLPGHLRRREGRPPGVSPLVAPPGGGALAEKTVPSYGMGGGGGGGGGGSGGRSATAPRRGGRSGRSNARPGFNRGSHPRLASRAPVSAGERAPKARMP